MAKKTEIKKIRPSEAVRSLSEYNDRVLLLVQNCDSLLQHNLVDKRMADVLRSSVNAVKEFYEQD